MNVTRTTIEGLIIIEGFRFSDLRGELIKPFSTDFLKEYNFEINLTFKEIWFTKSHKDVIRAMHLQIGEKACEKIVSVISGAVQDVVLDLRIESETYGMWFDIELNEEKSKVLYIPKGCAHGYKVLKNNTITMYMATETNDAKNDVGILWNSFGYNWGIDNPILSEKDKVLPKFKNL